MTDLSDAALRERAYRWCGANQTTYSEWTVDELTTAFIALRDAAKREGAMEEAAKHADCCVAREELDAARADLRVLVAQVNDIANDCDEVAGVDVVGPAERRTWLSIAQKLRAAAGRAQGEALQ